MFLNCGIGEDSWESLGLQEIQPVHLKGDQSWVFIRRTDVEAETPILWPPDAKSWLVWKDSDVGTGLRQKEKGMTEDEMVRWHHRHNGHGFGWTPGVGDGQGGLGFCISWGRKAWGTTEQLNWTAGKESTCNAGDMGSIPGLGKFLGKGKGYLLQYSGLENSMDCIVHGVTKSWTRLSDFNFHYYRQDTVVVLECIFQNAEFLLYYVSPQFFCGLFM